MKIINTFKDKKITLLVVFLILFINITAYSQNTNDSGTTNTASTTLVEKEQKRKDSCELKAKPITSVSKETATNEQEDEEDWVVENDGNWIWLFVVAGFISAVITGLIYYWCRKKNIIHELYWDEIFTWTWRWNQNSSQDSLYLLTILFGIIFFAIIAPNAIITKKKYISSIVVDKSIEEGRRGKIYEVRTDYKGVIFTHSFSKKNYDKINIKDTFCFEVRNGLWNTNISITENACIKFYQDKSEIIRKNKQYIINNKLLLDDLNSLVSLEDNSKGEICIEFCLSDPLMNAYKVKVLSDNNQKVKDEFIEFISNLNNCGKVSESGKYVLYCEFDKGKIHRADLTKTD